MFGDVEWGALDRLQRHLTHVFDQTPATPTQASCPTTTRAVPSHGGLFFPAPIIAQAAVKPAALPTALTCRCLPTAPVSGLLPPALHFLPQRTAHAPAPRALESSFRVLE